jgi:hypothetical protein
MAARPHLVEKADPWDERVLRTSGTCRARASQGTVVRVYRVAADNRSWVARPGSALLGEGSEWVPWGIEHAFRLGDPESLCGLSLGPLWLFPDNYFLVERDPAYLCARCAASVAAGPTRFRWPDRATR